MEGPMGQQGKCGCPHHKFIPLLMVPFALTFLLGTFEVFTPRTVSIIWPILVGAAGIQKMFEYKCKCC
jgi:hypothetical protein